MKFTMKRLLMASVCVVLISCLFAGCGAAAPPPSASSTADYYQESAAPNAGGGITDGSGYKYGESGEDESAIPIPLLTPSNAPGKKMIYTVNLRLQTTEFRAGMRKLLDTVVEMGGYVESATVNGRDLRYPETERNAGYTFRVPSERLSDFLVVVEDNYNLWSMHQESQDSTARYDQSDTRLSDLQEQEKRLLADLEKAGDTAERLSLERRLAEVQASISGLNASQSAIDESVRYSTVVVQLYEVIFIEDIETEPSFGQRLNQTVADSINGFVSFCQGFLLVIITIAPSLLILAIIAAAALPIIRIVKKRSQANASAEKKNRWEAYNEYGLDGADIDGQEPDEDGKEQ